MLPFYQSGHGRAAPLWLSAVLPTWCPFNDPSSGGSPTRMTSGCAVLYLCYETNSGRGSTVRRYPVVHRVRNQYPTFCSKIEREQKTAGVRETIRSCTREFYQERIYHPVQLFWTLIPYKTITPGSTGSSLSTPLFCLHHVIDAFVGQPRLRSSFHPIENPGPKIKMMRPQRL